MKIAFFTDVFEQASGVSTHVKNMARLMSEKGHDVTVFTGKGKPEKGAKYRVVNLPKLPFPLAKTYDIVLPKRLRVDADVVHVHTPFGAGLLGVHYAKALDVPLVMTTHTLPMNLFPGAAGFLRPLGWRALCAFYNQADFVVYQAERTKKVFEQHGVKRPNAVISAGVDFSFFSKGNAARFRRKYGIRDDFVFSASRLSFEKRVDWFLEACQKLGVRAVVSSEGPLFEKFKKDFPKARFLGFIPKNDLRDAFSAASAFVLCSAPWTEGEGLSVLEAMSAGTPVIASDVPHLVTNGKNGFGFETQKQLEKNVETVMKKPGFYKKRFRRAARETARVRDAKTSARRLLAVYKRLA